MENRGETSRKRQPPNEVNLIAVLSLARVNLYSSWAARMYVYLVHHGAAVPPQVDPSAPCQTTAVPAPSTSLKSRPGDGSLRRS